MFKHFRNSGNILLLLLPLLLILLSFHFNGNPARGRLFLSDRAAAISGAGLLAVPGLVAPGGLTGKGEIVGLADSGLGSGTLKDLHPDLENVPGQMPKVVMLKSWTDRETADDPVGHGTHLAGIIAGTGAASGGGYRGIAPGSSIYFQGILDAKGQIAPPEDLARLFQPAYEAGVRVHVNGWGGGPNGYREASRQVDDFVHRNPDFLPIFGAGNTGPVRGTLTAEANSKNALVVGASEIPRPAFSPSAVDARAQASFSSRGPAEGGRLKPDLLAPGSAVVAARSSLVKANYPAHEEYNVLSGTSQAAAVTGGAAAVLREYLKTKGVQSPSAALVKALLVNGAWTPPAGPTEDFPGILDLAATVLALEAGTMKRVDYRDGLPRDGEVTYQYEVGHNKTPLKITLAWTDPAPAAGAAGLLVNDLDLEVTAPDGTRYYGNDFQNRDEPDRKDNLEKVYIKDPQPGIYTLKVRAHRVQEDASRGPNYPGQDFALVFGQPLERGIVKGLTADGRVELSDGRLLAVPPGGIKNCVDGKLVPAEPGRILPGSEAYLGPQYLYLSGRTWASTGVQVLDTAQGNLFLEINSRLRSGGYYLNPAGSLEANGRRAAAGDLPPGFSIEATLNPATETLWQVLAGYSQKEGFLASIDREKRELKLLNDGKPLVYKKDVAVTFADRLVYTGAADLPYGAAGRAGVDALVAGMAVRLVLEPGTDEVQYIAVKRELALGRVSSVTGSGVVLENKGEFTLFPGAQIERDGKAVQLPGVRPGDWAVLNLLPDTMKNIAMQAYSTVNYGRVLYIGGNQSELYLMDHRNEFQMYSMDDATEVYRWGLPVSQGTLTPGDWVRVTAEPETNRVRRIDAANQVGEVNKTLQRVEPGTQTLVTSDGGRYRVSDRTLVTIDGYRVAATDLTPGVPVNLVLLSAPGETVVARVTAGPLPGSEAPRLDVSVLPQGSEFLIKGTTTADRLYMNIEGEDQQIVPVTGSGNFQRLLAPTAKNITLVALDRTTGSVTGKKIDLDFLHPQGFWDTRGHWAEKDINAMVARELLVGYEDGSFRPNNPLTRVELVTFMVRVAGWDVPEDSRPDFKDLDKIPSWARASIAVAQEHGLVKGYPDGTFRPDQPVNRVEAAAFIIRFLGEKAPEAALYLPYKDYETIPKWGREAVARAYAGGFMRGVSPTMFSPLSPFTRAQGAAVLSRLPE